MSDLRLFRVLSGRAVEVQGSSMELERHLQALIESNMDTMLGVRFLASEYPTGRHRGRIDSLGLDQNGNPVILEYKRTRDKAVITQALSYLSWLHDHHHEFESLVKEKLGPEVADTVDWSNPRLVCVAGDFTPHDAVALDVIGRRIDLVSYTAFGDVLTLRLVASFAGSSSTPLRKSPMTRKASSPAAAMSSAVKPVNQAFDALSAPLRELYADLDALLMGHGNVHRETQLHYVAYRRINNVATVRFQPRNQLLAVNLWIDPDSVELEDGFTRDIRTVGCLGGGSLEVRISSHEDLARAAVLIRDSIDK